MVLGLPESTPIRAAASGIVRQVLTMGTGGPYGCLINIEHGGYDTGMFSGYCHIKPSIPEGVEVHMGDVIGTPYVDPGSASGRLSHLHFSLVDGWGTHGAPFSGGMHLRFKTPVSLLIEASTARP